ncbi:VOC family protein [Kibdelosporangium philippinense]|uniref:VOC family protein n=1 Tax=Kibdelosporangium philippinense TaxID=211113 RepID=A0ABS8ZG50_9PSEU|nr:VOC family protein [Kibdelosporangium philippinense]MCE7006794.1 VOC family protein [Kibdelosporangium philippinense]
MAVELNHIIVSAKDAKASATFLADILGLEVGDKWGPFYPLVVSNGVTLDYIDTTADIQAQHCAFLVTDEEFDASFERIKAAGIPYWADPHKETPNEINHLFGGRGVYFDDPDGHVMEIITAPYA